ncbi:S8 family serine peptidase [Micromonospora sp. WMMA1923]|uniref:S8 family serine peptidase n=1 Tax=Micromonospora sp. WMMA1923 TaxID=3404125 RepID=UPI003B95E122
MLSGPMPPASPMPPGPMPPAGPVPPGWPPTAGPGPGRSGSGPWPVVLAALVGLWTVGFVVVGQAGGWLVDQVVLATGLHRLVGLWPGLALGTVVVLGTPTLLLALLPRSPAVRATGRVWLAGTLSLGVLLLLRAVPPVHHEAYLALLAGTAALLALVGGRVLRRAGLPAGPGRSAGTQQPAEPRQPAQVQQPAEPRQPAQVQQPAERHRPAGPWRPGAVTLLAAAAGLLLLLPWVWVGALGGLLETALAALAAAAVGALAGVLLDAGFWARFTVGTPPRAARLVLVGGLVAGVALLLLAAGTGQSGAQLPALFTLPPVGFVLAALHAAALRSGRPSGSAATRWLVGLGVFGPLAYADPEEITLLLADSRDVPFWVAVATAAGLAVAVALAIGYGVVLGRARRAHPARRVAVAAVAVGLAAVAVVGLGPGQPGLHGERLLVVLREQADLTDLPAAAPGRAGRDARVTEVHRRLVDTAERTQVDLRRELRRLRLAPTPYYLVNAIETDGGPAVRAWLSRRPEVARVLVSQRLRPLPAAVPANRGDQSAPAGPAWNISLIGADRVWSEFGVTGAGVVVGSSDSGVDGAHPALSAGFRGGDDSWYDPWAGTPAPTDRSGHGTHTLGSAVGRSGIGVAPDARWTGCVNLNRNLGSPARYLDCLQFMLAPFPVGGDPFRDGRPARAPDVLTNSWGCPPIEGCDPGLLRPATAALEAAGIFVVAAAGNTGPSCGSIEDPPATYPDVLTVGAVDRQRQVTIFSSRGPAAGGAAKPDLVAPGAGVLSAMPGGGYATLDGTSMATPQVAGVVALMWSANPDLVGDVDRTRQLLRDTATPARPDPDQPAGGCPGADRAGAGVIDAYAAVQAARG